MSTIQLQVAHGFPTTKRPPTKPPQAKSLYTRDWREAMDPIWGRRYFINRWSGRPMGQQTVAILDQYWDCWYRTIINYDGIIKFIARIWKYYLIVKHITINAARNDLNKWYSTMEYWTRSINHSGLFRGWNHLTLGDGHVFFHVFSSPASRSTWPMIRIQMC